MQPKFEIGQQVKFVNDHDRMTGKVLSVSYNSEHATADDSGFTYKISSRVYDSELNDMSDGFKICRENELTDMADYTGSLESGKPDKTLKVEDKVNK